MTMRTTRLARDAEGHAWSEVYGDVYASRDGALGQARHVFLRGNGLPDRWRDRDQFVIVETGFGLGVNFSTTRQAWRDDPHRPVRLHYVSIELHPLAAKDLVAGAPPELRHLSESLARVWPVAVAGLHRAEFEEGRVVLTLAFGDARELLPRLEVGADAFYLDGFAPARNPQMWEPGLLKAIGRRARLGATLATYTTAQPVRDALAAAGFELTLSTGFGQKRHMLTGVFAPRWRVRRHEPPKPFRGMRSAMVVGAGLAGAACAAALARRGWRVDVIERATKIAAEASSLRWGLLHPQLSVDDNLLARLSRAGVAMAQRSLDRVAPAGDVAGEPVWRETGIFQQFADPMEASRWSGAIAAWPCEFVSMMDAVQAVSALGMVPRHPGLWWPGGRIVSAQRWCAALLEHPNIRLRLGAVAANVAASFAGWSLADVDGNAIGEAPVLIAANAFDAPRLLSFAATLSAVRGRITMLDPAPFAELKAPVAGGGHLLRAPDGSVSVGATYETPLAGEMAVPLEEARATSSNLARLDRLLANAPVATPIGTFDGQRCVARDRLPMAGAIADAMGAWQQAERFKGAHLEDLPRREGVFACIALGSRGLTLAALLGELIACRIEGEPLPIERDLAAAVDPARFLLRELRAGRRVDALRSDSPTPSERF